MERLEGDDGELVLITDTLLISRDLGLLTRAIAKRAALVNGRMRIEVTIVEVED